MCIKNCECCLDKPQDECGVFGIYSNDSSDLARVMYYGLYALQHRGQESCGIAVTHGMEISYYKNLGLVNEVLMKTLCKACHKAILLWGT